MNAESKLEQAAKDEALKIFPNGTYNDGYYDMIQGARREGYEECYVKYWQSLTTPAGNEVEGKFKGAWVSAKEGWPNEIGSVPIQYEDGRIDTYFIGIVDDRSKDTWFKCAEHWLYKWWDKNAPSKPHTVEDPFIEKHLAIIKEKTIENLIHVHIEGMGELEKASVKYFLETGKVNGSFLQRLKDLILSTPKYITPKPTVEEGQTQEPVGGMKTSEEIKIDEIKKLVGTKAIDYCIDYHKINNSCGTLHLASAYLSGFKECYELLTPPPAPIKKIVNEDMICPETNKHCDDECCTVGSECNISGENIQSNCDAPIKTEGEDERMDIVEAEKRYPMDSVFHLFNERNYLQQRAFVEGAKYADKFSAPPSPVGIDVDHEAEKEVMMQAFDKVYKMFQSRSWIMEGRGSYHYNDDRYKEEVRYLYDEFESLHKETWANIKSKSIDFRKKVIEQYKKDLENPYFRLSEGFSLPQSSTDESPSGEGNAVDDAERVRLAIMEFDYWRSENFKQVMSNGYESKIIDETVNHQRRYTRHELYQLFLQSNK